MIRETCTNPSVTVYYEDTDFDGVDGTEFLSVYNNDTFITSCGSNSEICGDYKYCLQDYSVDEIPAGGELVIKLTKGNDSGIPSGCDYSLWADITLKCGGTSAPSTSPTGMSDNHCLSCNTTSHLIYSLNIY